MANTPRRTRGAAPSAPLSLRAAAPHSTRASCLELAVTCMLSSPATRLTPRSLPSSLLSPRQRKNKVGWNRTLRGDAFADVAEAFLSDSEYSDEYESEEDYDSDDYTDEDEEDALSDDYVAEQARLFLLTQ
jgi:hypothetical protein